MKRLREFLHKKCDTYAMNRSIPAEDNSSRMSPYFAAGVVSICQVLSTSRKERNNGSADFSSSGADAGLAAWVREIVFREFYRHMMVVTPHNSMNLPQNLKFDFVEWEDDEEGWRKWTQGTTGVPFVDAGMRQLTTEAYMHNRLRINVSSYLRTNLLLDYRRGERWSGEPGGLGPVQQHAGLGAELYRLQPHLAGRKVRSAWRLYSKICARAKGCEGESHIRPIQSHRQGYGGCRLMMQAKD